MASYFVETYRPPFPQTGARVRAHRDRDYSTDALHPCMTSVWHVTHVRTKDEAIAVVIERAAGKRVTASQVF